MKTINYKILEKANACPEHLDLFRVTFGEGDVDLSDENLILAQKAQLDIRFLERFLSNKARAEYDKVCDEAYAEYVKVRDEAWAEYKKVCDKALIRILRKQA